MIKSTIAAMFKLLALSLFVSSSLAVAEPVRGSGSTFAAPLILQWSKSYRDMRVDGGDFVSSDWAVDYELLGSLGGMVRLSQPEMDFGATDAPLPPAELQKRGYVQFPFVVGGVAIVVNIDGIGPGQLKLSGSVLADIYLGKITSWSDAAIKTLNPDIALPSIAIKVVHRQDGSGTTQTFTEYLSATSGAWKSTAGADVLIRWPAGIGADGSQALITRVKSEKGAIGYVEFGQMRRAGLVDVQVQNRSGVFVRPDAAAFQATADAADWAAAKDFFVQLTEVSGAQTYPMTAATFALVPRTRLSRARLGNTLDFFRLGLDQGGGGAIALGYIPLPPRVVSLVKTYWASELKAGS